MKGEEELTLVVLEQCLKEGSAISIRDLEKKVGVPEKLIKRILSVLESRGYLTKAGDTDGYVLSGKIAMLI